LPSIRLNRHQALKELNKINILIIKLNLSLNEDIAGLKNLKLI